jgi:SAM-dependent methyltransferase
MDSHQVIWDDRYEKVLRDERTLVGEPWLAAWLHLVPPGEYRRAFDVGCGPGYNTCLLLKNGFEVSAIDISKRALELVRREAPKARVEWADIRNGVPFTGDHFELIVADLSLHYFAWDMTVTIVKALVDRLVPGGLFAGRFNSTRDTNYGAGTGKPISDDRNLFVVDGIEKRFFTRDCFGKLFGPPWKILSLEEKVTCRFGPRKILWEVAAAKRHGYKAE